MQARPLLIVCIIIALRSPKSNYNAWKLAGEPLNHLPDRVKGSFRYTLLKQISRAFTSLNLDVVTLLYTHLLR